MYDVPIVDVMERSSTPTTDISPLLGSREVADLLGMSREQVWRLWTSGRLPGYRFDRHIRFSRADLERFMSSHYSASSAPDVAPRAKQHRATGSEYRQI